MADKRIQTNTLPYQLVKIAAALGAPFLSTAGMFQLLWRYVQVHAQLCCNPFSDASLSSCLADSKDPEFLE